MDTTVPVAASFPIMFIFRFASSSHPGVVRDNNEDAHLATPRLLMVADGVGGHACGEVASALAADAFASLRDDHEAGELLDVLRDAAERANTNIAESVRSNSERTGMATTVTALLLRDDQLGIIHAGDSRAYLLRDGELAQVSRDDSLVQDLLDEGDLDEADVKQHPYRSVVTKVLQGRPVDPTVEQRTAREGDRYLVCSDGLSDVVGLDQLREILSSDDDVEDIAEALVRTTLHAGAPDNVTVLIGDVIRDKADPNADDAKPQ